MSEDLKPFKVLIRVVKSILHYNHCDNPESSFGAITIVKEPLVYAKDKKAVKDMLLQKYPQFFQNNKIYEKETRDEAQFFYVLIYPLYQHEIDDIKAGQWTCSGCGQVHENRYVSKPKIYNKIGVNYPFCGVDYSNPEYSQQDRDKCLRLFQGKINPNHDLGDDMAYVKPDSLTYIYKVTEKETGKCYIGKTKNEPFFRWWNHLKHSTSPFGVYLRNTSIENWTFEVLETIPAVYNNSQILEKESLYIIKYDSIKNGFNTLISNKDALLVSVESELSQE